MAYYDYISLVGNLEETISQQGINHLAFYEVMRHKIHTLGFSPWDVEDTIAEEKRLWTDFVNAEPIKEQHNYCYVSVNHTSQRYREEGTGILSVPANFAIKRKCTSLPHRIERYVASYPQDLKLSEAEFIVDGKYRLIHNISDNKQTLKEAFDDQAFSNNFVNMLDVLSLLPENLATTDENEKRRVEKEVMASATVAPLENLILDTLSVLAEEVHQLVKKVIDKRLGHNYLGLAEKEQLFPSAIRLQDYINIRHLMHHQWDTLDGMGKFSEKEALKNTTVRRRFLDSYASLCDKPLKERLKSYIAAASDFVPLVTRLNPFVFVKGKDESNNKFVGRFKAYQQAHPEQKLYVETGIHQNNNKKQSLIKTLERTGGDFDIMDKGSGAISDLEERLRGFVLRRMYLDRFSDIEYRICQYTLFSGQNLTPAYAWNWLKMHKVISPQEAEMWAEYRRMRNQLSHKYSDNELNQQVFEILPDFQLKAQALQDRIDAKMPEVRLVADNIYEAVHKNGKVVQLDYKNKRILSQSEDNKNISNPQNQTAKQEQKNVKKSKIYAEEYPNGLSMTISGADVISCHLETGVTLDIGKNFLAYDDGTKVYFSTPNRAYIIYNEQEKIIADSSNMEVLKCVKDGKIIFLDANDRVIMSNRRSILVGKKEEIKEESWVKRDGQRMSVKYVRDGENMYLHYNDGTVILLKPNAARVWHNGVELTYAQRQNFADTYINGNNESALSISAIATIGKQK